MMKKYLKRAILLLSVFVIGLVYGIAVHKFEWFPYEPIKAIHSRLTHESPPENIETWSIGFYEGTSPLDLHPATDVENPILSGKDISDRDAVFVADPFLVVNKDGFLIFFEMMNRETGHGDICYAQSNDGRQWDYKQVILDEDFHLSYPRVFEWDNNYYLIPESHEDLSVRLYRAVSFPSKWEFVGNLLSGHRYLDPTLFRHNDKWWLFAGTGDSDILNLYFSENLHSGWNAHPRNPIVKFDAHIARPAGPILPDQGKLFRLAQDDFRSYGKQVLAFEITQLSETEYGERFVGTVLKPGSQEWNAAGMHHMDAQHHSGRWIAVVDGRSH